jgi:hypothetical protein
LQAQHAFHFPNIESLRESQLEWNPAELARKPIARSAMRARAVQGAIGVVGMSWAPLLPNSSVARHASELIQEADEAPPSAPRIATEHRVDAAGAVDCIERSATKNLPLAARRRVGHIGLVGDVAEWLKAAVC